MRKIKSAIICLLVCAVFLGGGVALAQAAKAPSETDPFVSNYYVPPIDQDAPFFDVVLPEIQKNIATNNQHSVSPYYDKLPLANNPENFQGLGSTTYANINGKTVTAEAFYRIKGDSLNDPNNGMGLLIYQCIQYKRAHPKENVEIYYSSYRTSATASVCVLPESKYYGYMRSLYGTNYDEHGFVRISYMLTEAARMGIKVTMINQLNSYAVKQYNPTTGKLQSRSPLSYITYFNRALTSECYNSYAPGKSVSDFMNFVVVDWNVTDKTSDMQHVKSAAVSHYLATDGTEHKNAVFFESSNLDDNDYLGCNGNGLSQSGVIVSDHDDLYRVTKNYMEIMAAYSGQEEMFEMRKYVYEINREQAALIRAGRGNEIPANEQIVYLGDKDDPIFQLYFTPLGSSPDTWDVEENAVCHFLDKMAQSTGYVELVWNDYGYSSDYVGVTTAKMIEKAFCENPDPENKISIRVPDVNLDRINALKVGSEIGKRSIKSGGVHSKDFLISYEEGGIRHRVSILTSCNYYMIAFNYRTNSMLVIHETDETDGSFYNIMAERYSYGMLKNQLKVSPTNSTMEVGKTNKLNVEYTGSAKLTWASSNESVATVKDGTITAVAPGEVTITVSDGSRKANCSVKVIRCQDCTQEHPGFTGSVNEQYIMTKPLSAAPMTMEAVFTVDQSQLTGTTTILGNDDNYEPTIVFSLNKEGNPRVAIRDTASASQKGAVYVFDKVNVATGEKVHLALVINQKTGYIHCFVNGKRMQSGKLAAIQDFTFKYNYVLSGDYLNGNKTYFPGVLDSVSIWSDVRSSTEIASDIQNGIDTSDKKLLASYDLTRCDKCMVQDLSTNGNNLKKVALWQDAKDVEAVGDYAYSFAVVGDTQTMCEADPKAMESIYDWILANQKTQKIQYVIGLGDITDDSTDAEWERANAYIGKLDGKLLYSLVRGNHDDWDDFNRNLHNGIYEKTVDGMMVSGNIELTDPNQPGLIQGTRPDGTTGLVTREGDIPEGGTVQGDLTNSYRCIEIQDTKYMIMTLDFAPNSKTLEWANNVIAAHPDHKVIVTTHAYMYRDGTTISDGDLYPPTYYSQAGGYDDAQNGDDMWEKCFSKHKNVLMVLSGHDPWQHVVYRQDKGENGNTVTQMLIDAQYVDRNIGSTAMVAMLYFSQDGKTMTVRYYSVAKDCYGSELSQFTVNLA